jgi:N utilization substance protein A
MIIIDNFGQVTAQIESERGISKEQLVKAVELALVSACKRKFPEGTELMAIVDQESGEANIYKVLNVVDAVEDQILEVELKEAKKIDKKIKIGEQLKIEVTPSDFGRIAAQAAKQVIIQRIREAEKNVIFDEFKTKENEILVGVVQRVELKNYLINLGRAEAVLFSKDQIVGERLLPKDKVKVFVVAVEKRAKGAFIHISRTHPQFLAKLLEQEIPEIQDGIIDIKSVARDPGRRAKVAVKTNNIAIGAVGTCVGPMGSRVQSIVRELQGEKIDVLEWDEDPKKFIANALKPAKISQVIITDEEEKNALVVVPLDQLSLAIGKAGVNVRLTVKLTGWKIDILSEEEYVRKADEINKKVHVSIVDRIKSEAQKMKESEEKKEEAAKEEAEEIKVSVLAKELKMKTAELMEKAKEINIDIKSNRSLVALEQAQSLRSKFKQ